MSNPLENSIIIYPNKVKNINILDVHQNCIKNNNQNKKKCILSTVPITNVSSQKVYIPYINQTKSILYQHIYIYKLMQYFNNITSNIYNLISKKVFRQQENSSHEKSVINYNEIIKDFLATEIYSSHMNSINTNIKSSKKIISIFYLPSDLFE